MSAAHDAVRALLRTSEDVTVVLEALLIPPQGSSVTAAVASLNLTQDQHEDPVQNKRVLAVVSHRDEWDLSEEGSLFICKYKTHPPGSTDGPDDIEVQRVFPIYGTFSIVMGQMRRGTFDLRPNATKALLDQQRSGFSLTINPAEGLADGAQPPTFYTHDVQALRTLVAECKRLREVSDLDASVTNNLAQSTHYFSWLRGYLSKRSSLAFLTSTPEDLRLANQPLLSRLSAASAGLPGDDLADIELIRDDWIRSQGRELSRKGRRRLNLRVGTFNVNGKNPSQDLSAWIQGHVPAAAGMDKEKCDTDKPPTIPPVKQTSPFGNIIRNPFDWALRRSSNPQAPEIVQTSTFAPERIDPDPDPDMFVLGFQELDLSTEALIYSTSTVREDAWCLAIFAALGEKAVRYEKLASKQLVGMLIVIIVKKSLKSCFGDVKTASAGAGLLGVMGNKGGTAIQLKFTPPSPTYQTEPKAPASETVTTPGSTTLTFVNAHLAAFDEMVDKRNSDFHELTRRLMFPRERAGEEREVDEDGEGGAEMSEAVAISVFESDALFWVEFAALDLNYRVDLPDLEVRRIVGTEDWDDKCQTLTRYDQLRKAMKEKKAFEAFKEYPITHLPSYRFSAGLMMDKLGYDLKRKPAWTDRILHMAGPACQVHQLSYSSHPQITMSDHRPVAADFDVDVDLFDKEQHEGNVWQLDREVDNMDTAERPSVSVDSTYVDFGKIHYHRMLSQTVNVQNTGKSPCAYRFVPAQADVPIHPEWLHIEPMAGLLLPGEVVQVTLSAFIDDETASVMNLRPKDLSSTVILRTVMGKDHFISIAGEYQHTCFANKLSTLTRLPGPIRSMTSPSDLRSKDRPLNAPREVMRLVNWLMAHTAHSDSLFLSAAEESMVDTIRECLDTGDEFPYPPDTEDPGPPLAFAATLVRLLDSLMDPIVPAPLHGQCIQMTSRDEAFEILGALPPASVNVWISITAFLHFICQSSKDPDHSEKLSRILAPVLLRDDPASSAPPVAPAGKRQFLLYFLS